MAHDVILLINISFVDSHEHQEKARWDAGSDHLGTILQARREYHDGMRLLRDAQEITCHQWAAGGFCGVNPAVRVTYPFTPEPSHQVYPTFSLYLSVVMLNTRIIVHEIQMKSDRKSRWNGAVGSGVNGIVMAK